VRTVGLLGGMSWESTVPYYRRINQLVSERLGGLHSAKVVLYSVDFHDVERLQQEGRWEEGGAMLAAAARALELAGADFLVLCTNTMHKVATAVASAIQIPLLHIADATAEEIRAAKIGTVGLLGTRFTMEEDFYRGRLQSRHGLRVSVPGPADRALVHRVIYEELCLGRVREPSRREFTRIIGDLAEGGAGGIILGCTEISLLVDPHELPVPIFDTTEIHSRRAVDWALSEGRLS
jgi:aspartate racemase